ncbi:MAG: bifunctional diguanylate cyclase/phosphodiesterase [Pseudomonadota bacterium]
MNRSIKNSGGQIASAIIFPMLIVVMTSVAGIFGLMNWSARLSDESAEESQHKLVGGALQLTQNYITKQQTGVVIWDEAFRAVKEPAANERWIRDNMMNWLASNHGFSKSVLFDSDFNVASVFSDDSDGEWMTPGLIDEMAPAIAKARARYITSFEPIPSGLYRFAPQGETSPHSIAETGIVPLLGEPHLFTAAAVVPQIQSIFSERKAPAVLVSLIPLRGQKLNNISDMSRLQGFVLAQDQNDRNGVGTYELQSPRGKNIGVIAWQASRPGTQMLQRINPFLAIAAFLIAAVVIAVTLFTRQMTKRLARSEAKAVHAARHDALSGLPNRSSFQALLTRILEEGEQNGTNTAVVYIDLDHFKDINDTLGHSAGDKVIVGVASRLKQVLPGNGIVARISGDEFAMVLSDCENDEWLEYILDQVQDEIARPVKIGRREIFASLSMGAAIAPRDGKNPDELLRKADIALYDAKANGRNRRSFFEPTMEHHVQSKDEMSRELRLALRNDQLDLAYQPQSDTDAKKIVSVEALARWTKEDGTVVPPSQFIPVAEETGLIDDLGIWVLNKACARAHDWPGVVVSVNVSPNQFRHPRFVEKVMAILAANDLPPQRLEIEVTESVFAGRDDSVLKALRRLKSLGIKVALDDFGSGYSSLSYLRRFPFDTLKIDRDFVSDMNGNPEAEAIIVSIIQLGKALGMTIVAEGIETIDQIRFLQVHDCHRMQGYFISRPLTSVALSQFLQDFHNENNEQLAESVQYPAKRAEG